MTYKNVDINDDIDFDILYRQSKVLYPDVDEWVLKMAVEGHINKKKQEEQEMPKMPEIN